MWGRLLFTCGAGCYSLVGQAVGRLLFIIKFLPLSPLELKELSLVLAKFFEDRGYPLDLVHTPVAAKHAAVDVGGRALFAPEDQNTLGNYSLGPAGPASTGRLTERYSCAVEALFLLFLLIEEVLGGGTELALSISIKMPGSNQQHQPSPMRSRHSMEWVSDSLRSWLGRIGLLLLVLHVGNCAK